MSGLRCSLSLLKGSYFACRLLISEAGTALFELALVY